MARLANLTILLLPFLSLSFLSPKPTSDHYSFSPLHTPSTPRTTTNLYGKQAKFGVFSPAVYIAKATVGEGNLDKIRGKAM